MNSERVSYVSLVSAALNVHDALSARGITSGKIYGIPRGGVPAAILISRINPAWVLTENLDEADLIVDDLFDSGATIEKAIAATRVAPLRRSRSFAVLFSKNEAACVRWNVVFGHSAEPNRWLVFPWEGSVAGSSDDIFTRLLQFVGEDATREGLRETPARAAAAWQDWTSGYLKKPEDVLKSFKDGAQNYDEMVLVKDIPVYSHCEHHLAPFFGVAHVAYVPGERIVGLSKIPRLVDVFAKRLQVQERLTVQIADAMVEGLKPKGVGVMLQCRHLCMESRGIARSKLVTKTTALRGVLRAEATSRAEFLSSINSKGAV